MSDNNGEASQGMQAAAAVVKTDMHDRKTQELIEYIVLGHMHDRLDIKRELKDWRFELEKRAVEYADDIWSDKSRFADYLCHISQAKHKKDKDSLILQSWPEFVYLVIEIAKQLEKAKYKNVEQAYEIDKFQKDLSEMENKAAMVSGELAQWSAKLSEYNDRDSQQQEVIRTLEWKLSQATNELSKCQLSMVDLDEECKKLYKDNRNLQTELDNRDLDPLQFRQPKDSNRVQVKYSRGESDAESKYDNPFNGEELLALREHSLPKLRPISPPRSSKSSVQRSYQPMIDTTKVIKFLKETVGQFAKKGSPSIISHLEIYEEAMKTLHLEKDIQKLEFITWVFEPKHRYFFNSLRDMGRDSWSDVVAEIKTEFGPYKSATAARRALFTLKCRHNQSPREFLSVLKNAYSLSEKDPNFEGSEFIQLFYDSLPNKIKFILARDYHPRKTLDWLLTESTTLYAAIQNCDESPDRKFKRASEEIAETHIKRDQGKFESPKRSYADVLKTPRPSEPNKIQPRPDGNKGPNVAEKNPNHQKEFRNRRFPPFQRYQNNYYRGYQRRPERAQSGSESDGSGRSQSYRYQNQSPKDYGRKRSNLYDRMDQIQDQFGMLMQRMEELSKTITANPKNPFLGVTPPVENPPQI